jgi:hypothetical protein
LGSNSLQGFVIAGRTLIAPHRTKYFYSLSQHKTGGRFSNSRGGGAFCAFALPPTRPSMRASSTFSLVVQKASRVLLDTRIGLKLIMPKAETSQLTLSDNRCPLELFREIPNRTSYYT